MANILAIDDEIPILELIKNGLQKDGHTVSTYPSVSQIPLEYLNRYDLIMLDIMMPDTDGFTFCKKIRSLAALNIYNGLLRDEDIEVSSVKEFADLSEQELDRIEVLVQNLLKITKLDAGSIAFEKEIENVADMMQDLELHFAYRAKQEQKEIVLSGADDISLFCDRDWLSEAIGNIVKNAMDHTEKGDTIHIKWKVLPSAVQITVKDNGCGIHPEDLYHIFKRFYRSRFSKDIQGIGLGLPLAKAIIEAHGGLIEVESELGLGTSFIMNFPIPTKL